MRTRSVHRDSVCDGGTLVARSAARGFRGALTLAALWACAGCTRPTLDPICPEVVPGQLVITELRGPQSGVDTYGQWIEIFNGGETEVDLAGLKVRLQRLDGSGVRTITLRTQPLPLGPGDYFVMGRFPPDALPGHVDYGYAEEFGSDLYPDGVVELVVCGDVMDRVIYHGLPETGSLSLDGSLVPSVEANDDESHFCVDDADVGGDPTEVGIPGTPGAPNRPCP